MEALVHLLTLLLLCFAAPIHAGIVAKSSITQCMGSNDVKTNFGQPCSKMLVVALTLTGDEVYTTSLHWCTLLIAALLFSQCRESRGICRQT